MIRTGILGAKGFAAGEAIRLLLNHPEFRLTCLMGRVDRPEPIGTYFPSLRGVADLHVQPMDLAALANQCDCVILALPHTVAQEHAPALLEAGVRVVDLSADFRFDSIELYEQTYGVKHLAPEINGEVPYALPELFAEELAAARAVACPGCYPTGALLALAPIVRRSRQFELERIVIDSMSGVTGAGRNVSEPYMFVTINEDVRAYNVGRHRHRPEISEKLTKLSDREIQVTFTPHLVPLNRGLLTTATVPMRKQVSAGEFRKIYEEFYQDRPFVRLLPDGQLPQTTAVVQSNFCDIGLTVDATSGVVIVNTAIDNLTKGASGQGIQAMNLMYGLPETLGLLPGASHTVQPS